MAAPPLDRARAEAEAASAGTARAALKEREQRGTCAARARGLLVREARAATRRLRALAAAKLASGVGGGGGEAAAGSASRVAAEPPAPGVVTVSEVELAVRPDFWIRMEPPPPASAAWAAPLWGGPSSSGRVSCSWPTPRFWAIQLLAVWARRALPTARRKAAPYSFVRPSCAGPARRPQAPGREIRRSAGTRRISERAKAV